MTPLPQWSLASAAPDPATMPNATAAGGMSGSAPSVTPVAEPQEGGIVGYFDDWMDRANRAQDEQPHWMTPVVTVTPRLEQEVRYDQMWEKRGDGSTLDIFDGGKGLELIPTETNEVLINPPAYQYKGNTASPANGWLDDQFLVVKQRLLSANEQNGNYILTAFLGITAESGNAAFTNKTWVVTPTIAGGKGWGDFDIQATSGIAVPFKNQDSLGKSIATNIALQYHLLTYIWPEFEFNDTYWIDGKERGGKNQLLMTPGVIFGRFVIHKRIKAIIGGGYQFAVTPRYIDTTEQTPAYNHAWILTARITF
ncbi:hypothetical protein [Lichenicoccus sp.]|uniref:hypothetical protein n=1 Tax=Lichenicoccus sp. TaxID=2781899 RepID=UPI003D1022E1